MVVCGERGRLGPLLLFTVGCSEDTRGREVTERAAFGTKDDTVFSPSFTMNKDDTTPCRELLSWSSSRGERTTGVLTGQSTFAAKLNLHLARLRE